MPVKVLLSTSLLTLLLFMNQSCCFHVRICDRLHREGTSGISLHLMLEEEARGERILIATGYFFTRPVNSMSTWPRGKIFRRAMTKNKHGICYDSHTYLMILLEYRSEQYFLKKVLGSMISLINQDYISVFILDKE